MTLRHLNSRLRGYVFVIAILLLGLLVRSIHLQADAPANSLSGLGVFLSDEGWFAHNIVNKILFNTPLTIDGEKFNTVVNTPFFSMIQYLTFRVFGVSFVTARMLSVVYASLTIAILYIILKRQSGMAIAMLATSILALNYVNIMYTRLALLEPCVIFFFVLSVYLHQKATTGRSSLYYIISGVCFSLALSTKITSVFWLGVFLATQIVYTYRIRAGNANAKFLVRSIGLFIVPVIILYGLQFLLWTYPRREASDAMSVIISRTSFSPIQVLDNYMKLMFRFPLFTKMPVMCISSLFYSVYVMRKVFSKRNISLVEVWMACWLLVGMIFWGFSSYQAMRYFTTLIVPMAVLSAMLLKGIAKQEIQFRGLKEVMICLLPGVIMLASWSSRMWLRAIIQLLPISMVPGDRKAMIFIFLFTLIILATLIMLLFWLLCRIARNYDRKFIRSMSVLAVALLFGVNIFQYLSWAIAPRYSMLNTAKHIGNTATNDNERPILYGNHTVTTLALENHILTVTSPNIEEYIPTHCMTLDRYEIGKLKSSYSDIYSGAELVAIYEILGNYYTGDYAYFYRLHRPR